MDERTSLRLKGRIAEVIEGGKVLHQNLVDELKSLPETQALDTAEIEALLDEMIADETIRKIVQDNNGRVVEYWELGN